MSSLKYIPELDGLRAIAVGLVIISHWIPQLKAWPIGALGVDIFFVLSGYLITIILLRQNEQSRWRTLKIFYIKRALRILPIYYLLVLCLYFFHEASVRNNLLYYVFHLTNFLFYNHRQFTGVIPQAWSLSVEEQFYIFWPFVILFSKRWVLPIVFFIMFSTGVIYSFIYLDFRLYEILPISCMPALVGGGAIALHKIQRRKFPLLPAISIAGFATIGWVLVQVFHINFPTRILNIAMASMLIFLILDKRHFYIKTILRIKTMVFIGKISYGLYLYHTIATYLSFRLLQHFNINNGSLALVLSAFLLLSMACLSYFVIERPVLKYKDKHYYRNRQEHKHILITNTEPSPRCTMQ